MTWPEGTRDWSALLARVLAADKDAAEEFAEALGVLAYNYYRRAGLSQEDAEELAQDFAVRVISHLHQFDGRNFIGWAFEILRSLLGSHCRRRKRQVQALPLLETDVDFSTTEAAQNGVLTEAEHVAMEEAIQKLQSEDRMLIESQIGFQRVPFPEIARELGLTAGNARLRYYRAKKYLEVILGNDERMKDRIVRLLQARPPKR